MCMDSSYLASFTKNKLRRVRIFGFVSRDAISRPDIVNRNLIALSILEFSNSLLGIQAV